MRQLLGCLLIAATGAAASPVEAADQCADILAEGDIRDELLLDQKEGLETAVTDWFCSDKFRQLAMSRSGDTAIEVPLKGVPLKFSSSESHNKNWEQRDVFCRDRSEVLSEHTATFMLFRVASETQQEAWLQCIKTLYGRPNLINFTAVRRGEQIALKASSNSVTGVANPIVIGLSHAGQLDCQDQGLVRGAEITPEGIGTLCTRRSFSDGLVLLQTTMGVREVELPPLEVGSYEVVHSFRLPREEVIRSVSDTHSHTRNPPRRGAFAGIFKSFSGTLSLDIDDRYQLRNVQHSCKYIVADKLDYCNFVNSRGQKLFAYTIRRPAPDKAVMDYSITMSSMSAVVEVGLVGDSVRLYEETVEEAGEKGKLFASKHFTVKIPDDAETSVIKVTDPVRGDLAFDLKEEVDDEVLREVARADAGDVTVVTFQAYYPRSR